MALLRGAGAAFALGALTRSISFPVILIPLFLLGIRAFNQRKALWILSLTGLSFVTVYSPWVIRNAVSTGTPTLMMNDSLAMAFRDGRPHPAERLMHEGYSFREARRASPWPGTQEDARSTSEGWFSMEYLRSVILRLRIMLGAHPCLELPFPFSGWHASAPTPVRQFNYLWAPIVFLGTLSTLVVAFRKRNLALLNLVALPTSLIFLYSLVHAIPRYQVVPYSGLSVPAGIACAFAVGAIWRRFRGGA